MKSLVNNHFILVSEHHNIINPDKEERHRFVIKLSESDDREFTIELDYITSIHEVRGTEYFKSLLMIANPRLVSAFLKAYLNEYEIDGKFFGFIEEVFVLLNEDIFDEDLTQYTDAELSRMLYVQIPSDHILYKLENGGWVDDHGNWHTYP
ncbi:hypothetical protein [Roseibium sediminis]|uniref:hypothetical protein n=1 Tax=Roseibium sediminis TaxID=1775174 RepID=UPI00123D29C4|nr:hypothetical protein [Roseibium sediminis]